MSHVQTPTVDASDEALMADAAAGNVDAITAIYDRYQSRAYALALRITGNVSDAEEVLQDAFVGLWRTASGYRPDKGSVGGWLLAMVRHRSIDCLRRRRVTAVELPDADEYHDALVVSDLWRDVSARLDRDAIVAALAAIPDAQRQAIELSYFGGLTHREIAAKTDAPVGTVKGRLRLGLARLRDELIRAAEPSASSSEAGAAVAARQSEWGSDAYLETAPPRSTSHDG